MDRNGSPTLQEKEADTSYQETNDFILFANKAVRNTKPILSPRFIPSCSDGLMKKLKMLQSHLSETLSEIEWVRALVPASRCYGDAYRMFVLFGGSVPTIMAHYVYSSDDEMQMFKEGGVYIAHCPESNINLASGIAPIRRHLENGLHVGLGSVVAGAIA